MAPRAKARPKKNLDERRRSRAEINAANNTELRANAQGVITAINESTPKNTSRNYDPKQREFQMRDA